jgi:hypothetical protein
VEPGSFQELRQGGGVDQRADCGQPRLIGSRIGPSSIMPTKRTTTKLSSSVVTTSSTARRSRSRVGPSITSAPAAAPASRTSGTRSAGGPSTRPSTHRDRGQRPGVELALGADVPQARPERPPAAASPVSISGVARAEVSVTAKREPRLPTTISR